MRTARTLTIGVTALAAVALTAVPAIAAPTDDTTTTFDVAAGTLDVTAPATANLGSGNSGTTITAQLGTVAVDDSRAATDASWTAEVESTDYLTGAGVAASEIVPAEEVDYWSGPATTTPTGDGVFTPGQVAAGNALPLSDTTPITAFGHTGGTGNNTAQWNPTLDVNVPLANIAGTYTGTVTHSVA